jgi:bacteriorhodopsin
MAWNIIAVLGLVLGLYLVYRSDCEKKGGNRAFYLASGIITVVWSLASISPASDLNAGAPLLAFGLFSLATVKTKGSTQIVAALIAILILLAFVV